MALALLETGRSLAETEDDERFLLIPDKDSGCPMNMVGLVGTGDPDSLEGLRSQLVGAYMGLDRL